MKERYKHMNEDFWFLRNNVYTFEGAMEAISLAYGGREEKKT